MVLTMWQSFQSVNSGVLQEACELPDDWDRGQGQEKLLEVKVSDVAYGLTFTYDVGGGFLFPATCSACGGWVFLRVEQMIVSVEKAMTSEPSNGSAKVISTES